MNSVFSDYASYYDLLYKDKDYVSEVEFINRIIKKYSSNANTILELGCGTGKHASLFAEHDYNVVGVECSAEMLNIAQIRAKNHSEALQSKMNFIYGDARTINLSNRFDIVTALFHVVCYQNRIDHLIEFFRNVSNHLHPEGIFIFDYWYGPTVITELPSVKVKRIRNNDLEITRIAEPLLDLNNNRVDVNYSIFVKDLKKNSHYEFSENHKMRYLFLSDIEYIAKMHGFSILNTSAWLTDDEPSNRTWSVYTVLKKV